MKLSFNVLSNVAALSGAGLVATPFIALGSPALAAADVCTAIDTGATEVLPGVCEVQFVEAGDFTFTPTSGIAKLTAVIVGSGGATNHVDGNYAGGGGAVVYVASVDTSVPVNVTVGLGAQSSSDLQGGASSVNSDVAAGGYTGISDPVGSGVGGTSGNGHVGSAVSNIGVSGAGGGAGADAVLLVGGVGVTASDAANDADLWPALSGEPVYGQGGDVDPANPGYGDAGWGGDGSGQRDVGGDGLVILRWTMKTDDGAAALPKTGVDAGTFAAFAAAFVIPGAALLAFGMRARRTRTQR